MLRRGLSLHELTVQGMQVLDLRAPDALASVGLMREDIADDDWTRCQAIGHAAFFLDFDGVLAPSATGVGVVLAAFETRLEAGQLRLVNSQPLTDDLYGSLRR